MDIVTKIENMKTIGGDKPEKDVVIVAAGHEVPLTPFSVDREDVTK